MASSWDDFTNRDVAKRDVDRPGNKDVDRPGNKEEAVTAEPLPPDEPEGIRRIRVDAEDKLAFRVGVNFLTLVILGLLVWGIFLYIRTQG